MQDMAAPTEFRPDNPRSAAYWFESAKKIRNQLLQIAREAEVAGTLLRSTEDDIDKQITDAEFMRIIGTQGALARIKDLAVVDDLPDWSSRAPAADAFDERNYHFWHNRASDLDSGRINIAEEAEVAEVLLISLEQATSASVEPALFLRLVGALDAVRRIQALAPAGPDS